MESQAKQKKKILYVITQGEWGGAQRYIFDLATNAPTDFEVFVAVGEKNGKKELQEKLQISNVKFPINSQIQIIQLNHLVRKISPIHDILAIFELSKLYKKISPAIIHLNSSKAGIVGSLANLTFHWKLEIGNWKLFYTVHGWVFNEPLNFLIKNLYKFLEKLTAKLKNKIIVLSDKDYNDGLNLGIPKNKLVKIPLGIEKPVFLERNEARRFLDSCWSLPRAWTRGRNDNSGIVSSPFEAPRNDMWVGTIANLYKTKGLDILIEAIKIMSLRGSQFTLTDEAIPWKYGIATPRSGEARNDNPQFIIIGEGPERKNLENLIKKYNLEKQIFLLGSLENASQYLQGFDIFVLPSRKEGLPYTLLEAQSANLPIVATDVGGIPEIIQNEKTGLLSPASSELLAENLSRLINDRDLQEKFKQNTKPNFTLEKMLKATFESYLGP